MHELARNTWIIAKREFVAYFSTPLATVFLIIFIALTGAFAFYVGGFFERGQADLAPFFQYHPWLFLLLVPAVAMRLWAEERKSGIGDLRFAQIQAFKTRQSWKTRQPGVSDRCRKEIQEFKIQQRS